jgi:hypothetical protein
MTHASADSFPLNSPHSKSSQPRFFLPYFRSMRRAAFFAFSKTGFCASVNGSAPVLIRYSQFCDGSTRPYPKTLFSRPESPYRYAAESSATHCLAPRHPATIPLCRLPRCSRLCSRSAQPLPAAPGRWFRQASAAGGLKTRPDRCEILPA